MTDKRDEKGDLLPDEERLTKFGVRYISKSSVVCSAPDRIPERFRTLPTVIPMIFTSIRKLQCRTIVISLTAIIILSPLFLILGILVRVKLGSPVFFRQKRPGRNGEIFTLCKSSVRKICLRQIVELPSQLC